MDSTRLDGGNPQGYLDATDLQRYLKIGRSLCYQLLHSEGCPSIRIGKRLLVNRDQLDQWLAERYKVG